MTILLVVSATAVDCYMIIVVDVFVVVDVVVVVIVASPIVLVLSIIFIFVVAAFVVHVVVGTVNETGLYYRRVHRDVMSVCDVIGIRYETEHLTCL